MTVTGMKCNHVTNPLGFTMDGVVLSWIPDSESADFQTASRVEVSTDPSFAEHVYDTGKSTTLDSICFSIPIELAPRTRYYWRVTVWAGEEEGVSDTAWFETAKMDEEWQGVWITPDSKTSFNPLFRKTFALDEGKVVSAARAYASAAGVYELEVNGVKAGQEYLAPFINQYAHWMQYQTYDITPLLSPGLNCVGALVGEGWYRGRFGLGGGTHNIYGDRAGFICEIVIQYEDGTSDTIGSDTSWSAAQCFITESSIYDGEEHDATAMVEGWSTAAPSTLTNAGDPVDWLPVRQLESIEMSLLTARLSLPVVVKETRNPAEVIRTPSGSIVLDMGQNMVGGFTLNLDSPPHRGAKLTLQFGEILQDGEFYRENLRTAKQTYTYVSDGKARFLRQFFTYFGYRYVKVTGWHDDPELLRDRYTGTVIYSDMDRTGYIETANPGVNRLFENAVWGQKGNFLDIPTDCPQRDERMGWTGDAQVFCGTASFNMDTYSFYRKYLRDMAGEQAAHGGKVPMIVPLITSDVNQSSAWSDATTIIPWTSYLLSGDPTVLREHFPSMKAYIESIRAEDTEDRNLWTPPFSFGDWLAQDGPTPLSYFGGTSTDLISSAYYYYSTRIVAKAASVLGYDEEAKEYGRLADAIRAAFQKEFITETGRLAVETQTAAVVTLFMDLAPKVHRSRIADHLYRLLRMNDFYLKTGFVGTPYLCRTLSGIGRSDVAYRLLLNEGFPSWLYCVNLGATTIWERWNSVLPDGRIGDLGMNSLNHYAYGSIAEWMYRDMCGINPVESQPGFRRVRIAPQPDARIGWARAVVNTPVGAYHSGWEIKPNGAVELRVTVPFGGTAELSFPRSREETKVLSRGSYVFEYVPTEPYEHHYSTSTTSIKRLLARKETAEAVERVLPGVTATMARTMYDDRRLGTLRDMVGYVRFPYTSDDLDRLDEILRGISVG